MTEPVCSWTDEHLEQMGFRIYSILTKAKEALESERKLLAAVPPKISEKDNENQSWCESHNQCVKIWDEVWFKVVARALLHPKTPLQFSGGIELLQRTPHTGMKPACKKAMIDWVQGQDGFKSQRIITQRAIDAIRECCGL
jgi:hypothetical protein